MLGALVLLMSTLAPTGQPGPMQPSDYTPAGQPNVVSWQLKRLPPPSALYVTADDFLVASAASSQANEVVTINIRRLDANDARPHLEQLVVAPGANRAVVTKSKPLAEGFILSISCQAVAATTRGQTFLRLGLGNSALGTGQPAQQLMADYVTTAMAPAHPNGRVLAPSEGPGNIRQITVANPGAGFDWALVVPTNARWRPIAVNARFDTSAVAGTRLVAIQVLPTGFVVAWNPLWGQAPSLTTWVHATPGLTFSFAASGFAGVNNAFVPLPAAIFILAGGAIQSSVTLIDVGDVWTTIQVTLEEWLDNV